MSDRYELGLTPSAQKVLKTLRSWNSDIVGHLIKLESRPNAGNALSGKLKGCKALDFNLKGSGESRAVYILDPERRRCTVFLIGPPENVYRKAERRVESLRKLGEVLDFA